MTLKVTLVPRFATTNYDTPRDLRAAWVDDYGPGLERRTIEACLFIGARGATAYYGPDGPQWGPDGRVENNYRWIRAAAPDAVEPAA